MRYIVSAPATHFDHKADGEADDEADENLQHG